MTDVDTELALMGDFTGNGQDDVLLASRRADAPGLNVHVGTQRGQEQWYAGPIANSGEGGYQCNDVTLNRGLFCYDLSRYIVGDFDGDGLADLMVASRLSGNGAVDFWLMRNEGGSGFATPTLWLRPSRAYQYHLGKYTAGDSNGDGFDDLYIIYMRGTGGGINAWNLPSTRTGFGRITRRELPNQYLYTQIVPSSGDVDGDGDDDLLLVRRAPATGPYYWELGSLDFSYMPRNGIGFLQPVQYFTSGLNWDNVRWMSDVD